MIHDKHGHAYAALLSERSRKIEQNYLHLKSIDEAHPERDASCLYCHSVDTPAAIRGERWATADGVGCERCHGAARDWIGEHFLAAWKHKSPAEKQACGFAPLQNLEVRAGLCADCHVGSGKFDVNHDLIAAGHPRLNFELASYQALMPPHWNYHQELASYPDGDAHVWSVGQVVSAREALKLLAFRADPQNNRPWPEFAEYDCYACHHSFELPSNRQRRIGAQAPGSFPWGTWYFAMLPQALQAPRSEQSTNLQAALMNLRAEMQKPLPNQHTVVDQARSAATLLNTLPSHANWKMPLQQRFVDMAKTDSKTIAEYWDSAAQWYLGLAAIHQAIANRSAGPAETDVRAALVKLREQLWFPPGYDSPRNYDAKRFETQRNDLLQHLGGK